MSSIDVASYHVETCVLHSTLLIGFASLMIGRRTLVEGAFHLAGVLPILVVITATRVAATAIASHADVGTTAQLVLLAYARWAPVPAATLLFTSLIAYFAFLTRQVEYVEIGDIVSLPRPARWEPIR
ncbi:MAG: hypothetical protein HYV60_19670 [Planctomycetia bacterium]|nr:hypothetical protein [Planctomycetia bacterium]